MIGIHRVQIRERGQAGLLEFVRLGGSAPNNVPAGGPDRRLEFAGIEWIRQSDPRLA